mmetsp:Transcript_13641/g.29261  ORF Transcript_13641/g.29261 Transcript_13641/m.29261 type:complete len:329 (+) Transcript_13641:95-1081(+)|eukprot:CAMPEP_0202907422 /NCGR_PEP_ID=MMETSP1392-20130828/42421_1 /ASSEMBLY_ACC=CAM_ASM_000868 /TAXON_ID=225041 /ORGANISM="Chlamydomonas chlamydogama, Strain SAG 11-48b" /LENGTH=328 /DNA_ID=CAMNT_0049596291 /DNA_START=38 /DNA_END=1024 /DNA_ORIENTATION=+
MQRIDTLPAVPAFVVVILCTTSFFVGHISIQGKSLQAQEASAPSIDVAGSSKHLKRREVKEGQGRNVPGANPLDPIKLQQHMIESSGLLEVRQALPPAASGDNFIQVIPFQILSWAPRIVVYPGFLDHERCDTLVELGKRFMAPSGLAFRPNETVDYSQQVRTSSGASLVASMDPEGVVPWLEMRIASITLVPIDHGEPFNILKYVNHQHYDSHYDTFDPKEFGAQTSQRIATVLVYLSDVEEGGETVFKREGLDGATREIKDWRNCDDSSFKYKPRKGDAVLFWATTPDGQIDPRALHGGCPVKKGEKWVVTKWLRSKPVFISHGLE